MAARRSLRRAAIRDIAAAYDWYEQQRAGLGEQFLAELDKYFDMICLHPEMYAKFRAEYRRTVIVPYSYAVFYVYTKNCVTIRAVLHTALGPATVNRRLS